MIMDKEKNKAKNKKLESWGRVSILDVVAKEGLTDPETCALR